MASVVVGASKISSTFSVVVGWLVSVIGVSDKSIRSFSSLVDTVSVVGACWNSPHSIFSLVGDTGAGVSVNSSANG